MLVLGSSAFLAARDLRALDFSLAAILACGAAQLVPLPYSVVEFLSPARVSFAASMSLSAPRGWRPLSIDPAASAHALLVLGAALAVFWGTRGVFHYGGIRTVARGIAFFGLAASAIGILQDASRSRLVYWWWTPVSDGPRGFGPFINRNHFAAWAVMALSLSVGYLAARTYARDDMDRFRSFVARLRRHFDLRTIWLLLAIALMTLAIVLSLSRSGIAAGATALVAAHVFSARRHRRRGWALGAATAILVLAILWTGPTTLVERWQSAEIGQEGRSVIWSETTPIVRDYWVAGTGIGAYSAAMTMYQRSGRETVHFNQAHNHYLQVLAEGGVVLLALCAAAAVLFVRGARERFRADHTGMLWLRVGAGAGLLGLAVSSIWETAARMPANALLAAVLAAIVLHEVAHRSGGHHAGQASPPGASH